jgi:hypothetical protein
MKSKRSLNRGVGFCANSACGWLFVLIFFGCLATVFVPVRLSAGDDPPATSPSSQPASKSEPAKQSATDEQASGCRCQDDEIPDRPDFKEHIEPLLTEYCYECHGLGEKKGDIAFDKLKADDLTHNPELWFKVLRNVRGNIMPPPDKERPTEHEKKLLAQWVKYTAFGTNPDDPDPGRVTLRRLNRNEYHNTIRDLLGYDFKANEEFPADDTGYGFDNIGDVLTVSPLLLEKYLQAAETIATAAVPTVAKAIAETTISGTRVLPGLGPAAPLSVYKEAKLPFTFQAKQAATYKVVVEYNIHGKFEFDPGRVRMIFKSGDEERLNEEHGWNENKRFHYEFDEKWEPGPHELSMDLTPLVAPERRVNQLDVENVTVKVLGPLEEELQAPAKGYDRFFPRALPPKTADERRAYAREILGRFAKRAFRRSADDATLDRLVTIAEKTYSQPDKKFEQGIQRAVIAVLASPRFLFHVEEADPETGDSAHPLIDEHSLASRLSYFLWSSMPDDELFRLADRGELRKSLHAQVQRMLKDSRSEAFIQNFVGQWLEVRDVEGVPINEQAVTAREDDELRKLLDQAKNAKTEFDRRAIFRQLRFRPTKVELNGELRRAMQQEVEMLVAYILRENHSLADLIDCDYTFLNEKLAQHYGIPDVKGPQMRRVTLPKDSLRGGILTTGAFLVVTSNPDRTSPVKRGLFILDNLVGSPPPPPPGNVPLLEDSEKEFADHEPSLREVLEVHRGKPLCSSCHSRMDPLGLGFENFNAMGMWREKDRGQPIESKGKLISGETFENVSDLKRILLDNYREDFYRCVSEKLMTYALGRGLTYADVHSVDRIVERLDEEGGRMSTLLTGIVDSAEFQRRRNGSEAATQAAATTSEAAVATTAAASPESGSGEAGTEEPGKQP